MLPITATQFGVNRLLEQTYRTAFQRAPGDGGTIAIAMGAGVCSSVFGCPAEYMMIQQQKSGRSLLAELKHTVQAHGALKPFKGLVSCGGAGAGPTAASHRVPASQPAADGCASPWAACRAPRRCGSRCTLPATWGCAPSCGRAWSRCPPCTAPPARRSSSPASPPACWPRSPRSPQTRSRLGCRWAGGRGGQAAGSGAASPSRLAHRSVQAFPDSAANPEYRSFSSTVRHIVQTEGPGTLFAGLIPRSMRIICAVFILNGTRSTLVDAIELYRQPALA